MIHRKTIPNGILLTVEPFSEPNANASCKIMARVTSTQGTRRDTDIYIANLNNLMTLGDAAILVAAIQALTDAARKKMDEVQEKAAQARPKKRNRKKK